MQIKSLTSFDYYASRGATGPGPVTTSFGISRQTFYRWKRCYDPQRLGSLEDGSHRALRRRRPTWTAEQVERVRCLRERYPPWGNHKLAVIRSREGWVVSVSMVGRILTSLRPRGAHALLRVKRPRGTARVSLGAARAQEFPPSKGPVTWRNSTPWSCGPHPAWS